MVTGISVVIDHVCRLSVGYRQYLSISEKRDACSVPLPPM